MVFGVVLHLAESHAHEHAHEQLGHEHAHRHEDGTTIIGTNRCRRGHTVTGICMSR